MLSITSQIVMKAQIVQKCVLVTGACGAVTAERHEQVRILRHARPEPAFIPVLAAQIALVPGHDSRRAANGRGRTIYLGPEGSVFWTRDRGSLCPEYPGGLR